MRFKLINDSIFALPGTQSRFFHLATVHYGVQEYMCFIDRKTNKVYIEEMTGGHLAFIDDDQLAEGLNNFLTEKGLTDPVRVVNWIHAKTNNIYR